MIDYREADFTRGSDRYDLIFDVLGNRPFSDFKPVLEPEGRYVPIGHEGFGATGHRFFGLLPHFFRLMVLARFERQLRGPKVPLPTRQETIVVLRDLLATGKLTPVVDSTYPLSEIHEAFRHLVEEELHGKVILSPVEAS